MRVQQVLDFIQQTHGKIFAIEFIKKNGELRYMRCRTDVSKGVKGIGSYDPALHNQIRVFDMEIGEFRTINIAGIKRIMIRGRWKWVTHLTKEMKSTS